MLQAEHIPEYYISQKNLPPAMPPHYSMSRAIGPSQYVRRFRSQGASSRSSQRSGTGAHSAISILPAEFLGRLIMIELNKQGSILPGRQIVQKANQSIRCYAKETTELLRLHRDGANDRRERT